MNTTEESGLEVSPVSAWKKASHGTPLRVPSGNTCMVKPANMESFIRKGLIPNELIPLITSGMASRKKGIDAVEGMDQDKILMILSAMDNVVMDIVVDPKIWPAPHETDERRDELLYIDELDMEDKTFIWQFAVGGTRDLEKFRTELQSDLAAIQQGEDVVDAPSGDDRAAE